MMHSVMRGDFRLVYFTPETFLLSKKWRRMMQNQVYTKKLKCVVFDEAHCITSWYVRI
jgi:superfamily II DNA helicase RecQ